jgi:N-acetyl sugar amidotransferase
MSRMQYCTICILPSTRPNLTLDEYGVCNACRNHQSRPHIDWEKRRAEFVQLVTKTRSLGREYDCLVPVSGGKDSTWQVAQCLEAGMKPLAVTWRAPGRTQLGQSNLDNLISLGVDHIDFSINPDVERRFMLRTFREAGSTAIPMHLAIFSIPLRLALQMSIPIVVYGENSAVEYGGRTVEESEAELDESWVRHFGVTNGTTALDWVDGVTSERDLSSYIPPSPASLREAGVRAIFLGHYFAWNPQMTRDFATARGFQVRDGGPLTGAFDFADIDDDFMSIHHWLKWHKFGFTRTFDNLSLDIRNGLMTRDQAIRFIRKLGDETPWTNLEAFCSFAGITVEDALATADRHRNPAIWKRLPDGRWWMPKFLIGDWEWR